MECPIIHAEDDTNISYLHTEILYWHAVNATVPKTISDEELERGRGISKMDLGAGG